MNPVDKIRELRKQNMLATLVARPHRRRIVPLDQYRSIGLIAHNLSDQDQLTLDQFTQHMTQRGVMVRKIVLPQFADEYLDKYGFPKPDFSQFFSSYTYDMLIDTTPMNDNFGLYVTLSTDSHLRVAYHDTTEHISEISLAAYDLIIRGEGPCQMAKFLTDLMSYLVQIRKQ